MAVAAAAGGGLVVALSAQAEPPRPPDPAPTVTFVPRAPEFTVDAQTLAQIEELEMRTSSLTAAALAVDEGAHSELLEALAHLAERLERIEDPATQARFRRIEADLTALGVLRAP